MIAKSRKPRRHHFVVRRGGGGGGTLAQPTQHLAVIGDQIREDIVRIHLAQPILNPQLDVWVGGGGTGRYVLAKGRSESSVDRTPVRVAISHVYQEVGAI